MSAKTFHKMDNNADICVVTHRKGFSPLNSFSESMISTFVIVSLLLLLYQKRPQLATFFDRLTPRIARGFLVTIILRIICGVPSLTIVA